MLDCVLSSLKICLIGFFTGLHPGDMLRGWNCLGSGTIFAVANAGRTAIATDLLQILSYDAWSR